MRRRERAVTSELRLNVSSDEKLSPLSPVFTHRMMNLSPIVQLRSQNNLVCDLFILTHVFLFFENQ